MPAASKPEAGRSASTADRILDRAENLIQTRGYTWFSYQDISTALGIRKASIHYHFASKTALGIAVLDRYAARFDAALEKIASDPKHTANEMLDFYFEPYVQFSRTPDQVCLCGALAGEMLALPQELRERVARFFCAHQRWLAAILRRGTGRGEFSLRASPEKTARLFFGALQGALLVKRTTGDQSQLQDVIAAIRKQLKAE